MGAVANAVHREPRSKGKIVGQKAPFKPKDIWALRVRLQMEDRVRELALFNLGIDSKLRGCDLVSPKVRDICHGDQVATRAVVMQHKTQRPVQFEIPPSTRDAAQKLAASKSDDFLFPCRIRDSPHLDTRQYARILEGWVEELGLDLADYGALDATHQGDVDLPADEEPARRAVAARRPCLSQAWPGSQLAGTSANWHSGQERAAVHTLRQDAQTGRNTRSGVR